MPREQQAEKNEADDRKERLIVEELEKEKNVEISRKRREGIAVGISKWLLVCRV